MLTEPYKVDQIFLLASKMVNILLYLEVFCNNILTISIFESLPSVEILSLSTPHKMKFIIFYVRP